jgi:hypothetical protein
MWNLRRYCDDRVYRSNCDPPYHATCLADLHYVMTSSAAAAFSTVDRHLNEFAFGSSAVEDGGRLRGNLATWASSCLDMWACRSWQTTL